MKLDNLEDIVKNSYKNFHAKGLDYICLYRSGGYTLKVYFLDGDVTKVPEVVNPHDHRYDFSTEVLTGAMVDWVFEKSEFCGDVYNAFDYLTPLNGGGGFSFRGEERLEKSYGRALDTGHKLYSRSRKLHTIQMMKDQTVLMLHQYEDRLPIDQPTSCWCKGGEPDQSDSGLYDKFTPDEVLNRLETLKGLGLSFKEILEV